MFRSGHDKCLAIRRNVVAGNGRSWIELTIEQFNGFTRFKRRLNVDGNTHHLGSVSINDFPPVSDPTGLIAACSGNLAAAATTRDGFHVHL